MSRDSHWNGEQPISWGRPRTAGQTWAEVDVGWLNWVAGEGDKAHAELERRERMAEADMSELERTVFGIFRKPLAEVHPDKPDGDHEKFIQLTRNRDCLLEIIRTFKQQQLKGE